MNDAQQVTGPGKTPEEEQSVPTAVLTVVMGPQVGTAPVPTRTGGYSEDAPGRCAGEARAARRGCQRRRRLTSRRGEGFAPEAPRKVLLGSWSFAEGGTCPRGTPSGVAGGRRPWAPGATCARGARSAVRRKLYPRWMSARWRLTRMSGARCRGHRVFPRTEGGVEAGVRG